MFETGLIPPARSCVPEYCLGGDFNIHKSSNGIETFAFSAKTYLSNVCERIEKLMDIVLKQYETPLATGDHPETILAY